MLIFHFASLLDVLFLQYVLRKNTFQAVSFRIERTINVEIRKSVLKLISLCNLYPQTRELCWGLPDLRLLAKTAHYDNVTTVSFVGHPQLCIETDSITIHQIVLLCCKF